MTSKKTTLSNGTVVASYNYELDKVGNITKQTTHEPYEGISLTNESVSYSYNSGNRITKAGDISFSFDENGNTINRGGEQYQWDESDRLTRAGSNALTYDPLGLIASFGDISFTTDPLGIGNVLSDSKSGAEYIYGNGLEARVKDGKVSYYVTDFRGSVVAIVDENNTITHKYQYDEYGKVTQKEEADYNPFQYVGKYGVMALTDHQYYMRARHYDPTIGRFLSEDPIWSTNLYPYADNNPIMGIDPEGEATIGRRPLRADNINDKVSYGLASFIISLDKQYFDKKNVEAIHEHIFFDKPVIIPGFNNGLPVTNIGFGVNGLFTETSSSKSLYTMTFEEYPDWLVLIAVKKWTEEAMGGYHQFKNNCQDYVDNIRKEVRAMQSKGYVNISNTNIPCYVKTTNLVWTSSN